MKITSEFVRQDWGSSRFRLRFRGEGADVGDGGGISDCVFNNCCADCCNKCVKLLISCPSFDCLSADNVGDEIVATSGFSNDACGKARKRSGEVLLKSFKLISVDAATWSGEVEGDDGTCKVPVPSEIARPSNWIDSVVVDAPFVNKTFCKEYKKKKEVSLVFILMMQKHDEN